jgi:hypothetical protein
MLRHRRPHIVGQSADRCGDLKLRFTGDDIHGGCERAVRAVVRNLDREVDRHPKRHAQHVQQCEQPMLRDVAQHVPAKEAQVWRCHRITSGSLAAGEPLCACKVSRSM